MQRAVAPDCLAQRLARKICQDCKVPFDPPEQALLEIQIKPNEIGSFQPYRGEGCATCSSTGYKGRIALYEVMNFVDELKEYVITLSAPADFQLKQMMEILKLKLTKRGIDIVCMKVDEPVITGQTAKQVATLRQGIDTELGKKIQRLIKDSKLKVQAAIQDKQVRVSGKSRDELQEAIALVRGGKLDLPLQFTNFRD